MVAQGVQTVLAGFKRLWQSRDEGAIVAIITGLSGPSGPAPTGERGMSHVDRLAAKEVEYERLFQQGVEARLLRDLPAALSIANPAARRAAVQAIIDREQLYLAQREQAIVERAIAAREMDLLEELSPQGAYWQLWPHVREHTIDCLALGERFWPWEFLREVHPPLHHGCPCRLLGLDEAISEGLMSAEQVPDAADARELGHKLLAAARAKMSEADVEAIVEDAERTLQEFVAARAYDENMHPRGRLGRWIEKVHPIEVPKSPGVTEPLDMEKLDVGDRVVDRAGREWRVAPGGLAPKPYYRGRPDATIRVTPGEDGPLIDAPVRAFTQMAHPGTVDPDTRARQAAHASAMDFVARHYGERPELQRLAHEMSPGTTEKQRELEDLEKLATAAIAEARVNARAPLRWMKGFVKGGEFRPQRGGSAGLRVAPPSVRAARGDSRSVWIRGTRVNVPEANRWERTLDGVKFTSPAGGTNVYRNGVLVDDGEPRHADTKPPVRTLAAPRVAPKEPSERAQTRIQNEVGRVRDQIMKAVASGEKPIADGQPVGVVRTALVGLGYKRDLRHRGVYRNVRGDSIQFRTDTNGVRDAVVLPKVAPARAPGDQLDRPPRDWSEYAQDTLNFADALADEYGTIAQAHSFTTDTALDDHAGMHRWSGDIVIGDEARVDMDVAGKARKRGPLTDRQLRHVWATYWTGTHEASHAVNMIDPFDFQEPAHAALEEALAEEAAHLLAPGRLRASGQTDVLAWRAANPSALEVMGVYRPERRALASLLDEAGITDETERRDFVLSLKFRGNPGSRFDVLAQAISDKTGGPIEQAREHVEHVMANPQEAWAQLPVAPPFPGNDPALDVGDGVLDGAVYDGATGNLLLSNGSQRRLIAAPQVPVEFAEISDGFAIEDMSPHGDQRVVLIDSADRGQLILRAMADHGLPEDDVQATRERLDAMRPGEQTGVYGVEVHADSDGFRVARAILDARSFTKVADSDSAARLAIGRAVAPAFGPPAMSPGVKDWDTPEVRARVAANVQRFKDVDDTPIPETEGYPRPKDVPEPQLAPDGTVRVRCGRCGGTGTVGMGNPVHGNQCYGCAITSGGIPLPEPGWQHVAPDVWKRRTLARMRRDWQHWADVDSEREKFASHVQRFEARTAAYSQALAASHPYWRLRMQMMADAGQDPYQLASSGMSNRASTAHRKNAADLTDAEFKALLTDMSDAAKQGDQAMKRIHAKFPGTCKVCGGPVKPGDDVWFLTLNREVVHPDHVPADFPPPPMSPGTTGGDMADPMSPGTGPKSWLQRMLDTLTSEEETGGPHTPPYADDFEEEFGSPFGSGWWQQEHGKPPKAFKDPETGKVIGGQPLPGDDPDALIPSYDATTLTFGKGAGGSNGARWAFDEDGNRWLVKRYQGDRDRVANELLANAVYRAVGLKTARAGTMRVPTGKPDFAAISDRDLQEPELPKASKKHRVSAGMIVLDPDQPGKVWIVEPRNHYGGYKRTFPKGGLKDGLTAQQNAHRELWEESGLHAAITGYLGDYEGDTGVTRYYLAVRTGGEPTTSWETSSVEAVTFEEAAKLLNRERDQQVLADAKALLGDTWPGAQDDETKDGFQIALVYPTLDGEVKTAFQEPGLWPSAAVGEGFVADALIGNWDFIGAQYDNVMWDPEGKPFRVDQGGAFELRAMGGTKPFGPVPSEMWTMLRKGQGARGVKVTEEGMREQARAIATTLTDDKIDELIDEAPYADVEMRERVRVNLKARVEWLARFADGKETLPKPAEGAKAKKLIRDTYGPKKFELFPEEESALLTYFDGGAQALAQWYAKTPKPKQKPGPKKGQKSKGQQQLYPPHQFAKAPEPPGQLGQMRKRLDGLLNEAKLPDDVIAYMPLEGMPDAKLAGKSLEERKFLELSLKKPKTGPYMRVLLPAGSAAIVPSLFPEIGDAAPVDMILVRRKARVRIDAIDVEAGVVSAEVSTKGYTWK